ncbi:kinesin light chain 3 [Pycnococcus provasolii]
MTTNDVCFGIVKPATEQVKIPYAEMLSNTKADEAQDATVFVSHAWKYTFVDVVDALNSLSENAYTCGSTCSQSTSARGCKCRPTGGSRRSRRRSRVSDTPC